MSEKGSRFLKEIKDETWRFSESMGQITVVFYITEARILFVKERKETPAVWELAPGKL